MDKKETENKFEQYREHLHDEVSRLSTYVFLYKHLHQRKQSRLDEMNIAPCFFQSVFESLYSNIILWVNNLLCPKADRGFFDFLIFIENNLQIFTVVCLQKRQNYPNGHWMLNRSPITIQTIKSDQDKITNLKSLKNFKTRRNKYHAHFDKKYAFEKHKIKNDAPIRWTDLDDSISIMKDILNTYSAAYDGKVYTCRPMTVDDVDYLLDILHDYLNNLNKE
ncbi:MAG: hypothetical protein ABSE89_01755 [Sedimentisphaerales bacterium]